MTKYLISIFVNLFKSLKAKLFGSKEFMSLLFGLDRNRMIDYDGDSAEGQRNYLIWVKIIIAADLGLIRWGTLSNIRPFFLIYYF